MSSCTFFGHRDAPKKIESDLYFVLNELVKKHNVDSFYVGNNGNFDHIVRRRDSFAGIRHTLSDCYTAERNFRAVRRGFGKHALRFCAGAGETKGKKKSERRKKEKKKDSFFHYTNLLSGKLIQKLYIVKEKKSTAEILFFRRLKIYFVIIIVLFLLSELLLHSLLF